MPQQRGVELLHLCGVRVAVDGQAAKALTQRLLQRGRQGVGVFHRVQFDAAVRRLHAVGAHGAHVGADAL